MIFAEITMAFIGFLIILLAAPTCRAEVLTKLEALGATAGKSCLKFIFLNRIHSIIN